MMKNVSWGCALVLILLLVGCGNGKTESSSRTGMSEMEQLKYDNTLKKLDAIYNKASELASSSSESELLYIREEIRTLKYDFNSENMDEETQKKCEALKARIAELKKNPDAVFQSSGNAVDDNRPGKDSRGKSLLSRKRMRLTNDMRFPYYFNAGDKVHVSFDSQGEMQVAFYDINRHRCTKQWSINGTTTDSVSIRSKGIYMMELTPKGTDVMTDVTLSYTGTDNTYRPRIKEKMAECKAGDFLAKAVDSIIVSKVFPEPKRVGLRGNLKSMFSGKSRALISFSVPAECDKLLYSLRISTNENTISSDGKFADQLSMASKRVKLFGTNVYETQFILNSSIVDRLLFNARPPREEDAFCNMYVFTNASQAKKFQDETSSTGSYAYDVEQSQMGTQSCNGVLKHKGVKTIYIGFENERMRYDNYIWFDLAALSHVKKYIRPTYELR